MRSVLKLGLVTVHLGRSHHPDDHLSDRCDRAVAAIVESLAETAHNLLIRVKLSTPLSSNNRIFTTLLGMT